GSTPMHVLLIGDHKDDTRLIEKLLTGQIAAGIELEWTDRLEKGLTRVTEGKIDVVLLGPSSRDRRGLERLDTIQERAPDLPIIMLAHLDDEVTAIQAVRKGAQDYLVKGR